MSAIGKNVFNIFLAVIVLFVAKHFLSDFGLKLYKMYYGVEGMTGNQKVPQKGTFISNEGRKWKNQTPFKVSENIYVFGGSDGRWFKMASVDSNGNFIENRYTNKCNSIDELTIDIWNSARRGGSYAVTDIILGPAAPAITELKSLERGATVYTGCGYTYSTKEDRDRQCGSGGTSKWIDDSNVINKLARGATVYTGCGYTYSTKEDRDRQCGSGGTSKWIDDRKPEPAAAPAQAAQAAPAQAAQAAPAQAAPAQAAPAQAAPVPVADTPMLIDATSCSGWDCNIEGQFCPKGVPGASAGNFLCKDKKWMQVDSRPTSLAAQASAATDEAKVADAATQASQMHSDAQIATNEPAIVPGPAIGSWTGNNDSGVPDNSIASEAASSNLATQQIIPGAAYPSNTTVANVSGVYPNQASLNNIQGGNAQQTMTGVNTDMAPSPLAPTSSESVSKANDAGLESTCIHFLSLHKKFPAEAPGTPLGQNCPSILQSQPEQLVASISIGVSATGTGAACAGAACAGAACAGAACAACAGAACAACAGAAAGSGFRSSIHLDVPPEPHCLSLSSFVEYV